MLLLIMNFKCEILVSNHKNISMYLLVNETGIKYIFYFGTTWTRLCRSIYIRKVTNIKYIIIFNYNIIRNLK